MTVLHHLDTTSLVLNGISFLLGIPAGRYWRRKNEAKTTREREAQHHAE